MIGFVVNVQRLAHVAYDEVRVEEHDGGHLLGG